MTTPLLEKGEFQLINRNFLAESLSAMQEIKRVQDKYKMPDTDTFMNEVRDSIAALYAGFTHINTKKHGFDARRKSSINGYEYDYLEVKDASISADSLTATFNDTTMEKALSFKQQNVFLALSVWEGASDLLFIVYGSSPTIGEFLEKRVEKYLAGKAGIRSTQSLSMSTLVKTHGFKIYPVGKSMAEVKQLIAIKCRSLLDDNNFSDITRISSI